jgi:Amino acid synthesis
MEIRESFVSVEEDATRPDETVVVVAVADGGRPHPRVSKNRAVV